MQADSLGPWVLGSRGIYQKRKRTHGHGLHLVIARRRRFMDLEEGIRGINGNGKNNIKYF